MDLWSRAREPMDNLMDGKLPPSTRLPTGSQAGRGPTGSTAPTATPRFVLVNGVGPMKDRAESHARAAKHEESDEPGGTVKAVGPPRDGAGLPVEALGPAIGQARPDVGQDC